MNVLIIVNTYSQLIISLQIKRKIYFNDNVSLIVTDFTEKAEDLAYKISNLKIFDTVHYIAVRNLCGEPEKVIGKIISFKKLILGDKIFDEIASNKWDILLFYNRDTVTNTLYSSLIRYNFEIRLMMFEEGILSYASKLTNRRILMADKLRRILNIPQMDKRTEMFYCFYPSIYHGNLKPLQIPCIDPKDKEFREILQMIFTVDIDKISLNYNYKYVFFSGMYDFEGGNSIGELNLIRQISNLVGNENLVIKVHPRDSIDRYKKAGLNVAESSNLPWEVIQLNCNLTNCVFLTVISGSVFMPNLIVNNPIKTILLYNLCNIEGNYAAKKNIEVVSEIMSSFQLDKMKWLKIAKQSIDEIELENENLNSIESNNQFYDERVYE